jgi:uncharacterized membrane protein YcaP (DUF421 family)
MVDWVDTFAPKTPLLEIFVRGTVVYLALFFLLRIVLKRESGTTGITDLLVIVLIADAAQNAMADDYRSITDGLLLVATIIGWSYLLNLISYFIPATERWIRPQPLPLVRDGQFLHRNMRRELLTEEELLGQLREQGVDDLSRVREMRMESDGQFSITTCGGQRHRTPEKKRQNF